MLTYLKLTHRTKGTIWEEALCEKCLAETPVAAKTPHPRDAQGYTMEVRPWTGANRECSTCPVMHEPIQEVTR